MLVHVLGRRRILAARQLDARHRLRPVHQIVARLDLHDRAVLDDRNTVAKAQRLVDVMAHVEHRAVERIEQADQVLLEHAFQMRVKGAERLVEHEYAGAGCQHAGERHALLLPAGKLRGKAVCEGTPARSA